jgi:6-phosphogluconolactonase
VVLPVLKDGSLGAALDAKKYTGNSKNKTRQEQPHIHSAFVSKDNKYVYVSDLGTDKIYTYSFDLETGKIKPAIQPDVTISLGAGPRHFTMHPSGKYAYSSEELTSTVGVFSVNTITGALTTIQDTVRSLPKGFKQPNTSADIHIDPQGKFLYLSNRGHDALAIYSVSTAGKIKLIGHQSTLGKTPRNFLIDPKGRYVLAANQNSDSIVIFKMNAKTGMLTPVGKPVKVPSPVCLKLLSLK